MPPLPAGAPHRVFLGAMLLHLQRTPPRRRSAAPLARGKERGARFGPRSHDSIQRPVVGAGDGRLLVAAPAPGGRPTQGRSCEVKMARRRWSQRSEEESPPGGAAGPPASKPFRGKNTPVSYSSRPSTQKSCEISTPGSTDVRDPNRLGTSEAKSDSSKKRAGFGPNGPGSVRVQLVSGWNWWT